MSSHPIFLHKGSWREFKLALGLHLKGRVTHWDSYLSQKIFMILQREELRERYLSGFPPLLTSEKLDLSLDDIIDPMETFEERIWAQGHYHPGRLTLNPDDYHHAYTESMGMGKRHVCKTLEMGWVNLQDGGSFCEGYRRPPREGEPYPGKHRLLDRPENRTEDPSEAASRAWAGLQDTYFLGGLPLIFWSRKRGNSMGMRVSTEEFCQPSDPADYRTVHVANFQRGRVAGFQWRNSKELQKYERGWYLPTETEYRCVSHIEPEEQVRIPRTYRSGSQLWIDKQAGVTHRCTDTYIHHIQRIEDIDVAHSLGELGHGGPITEEEFLEEREGLQLKTLGGW